MAGVGNPGEGPADSPYENRSINEIGYSIGYAHRLRDEMNRFYTEELLARDAFRQAELDWEYHHNLTGNGPMAAGSA